jgi:acyl carrier protein
LYGPTEDTIWTTWTEVPLVKAGGIYPSPPIGKPIANHQVYILGTGLRLQPIGIAGEICIGGDGTAVGYLNQPELTAETFLSFSYRSYRSYRTYFSKKIYKTGDLGRWLPDGNIEFLGRIDHQVKIRGFRIETGEIEGRLLNHENIKEAVVLARQDEQGEKHLCAYIVWSGAVEKKPGIMELKEHLVQTLPAYMIPAYFIRLEKIPLTPGGKIDRKALLLPGIDALEGRRYAAPRSKLEQELVEIWEAVLPGSVPIGIDDNFFEIGGHSLKAAVLAARINKTMKLKIPLSLIFQRPTVRALASYINRSPAATFTPIRAVEQKEYYHASYAQRRVWVLSQSEASSLSFNIHGAYLFEEEPDIDVFRGVFHRLIERHESLRTVFLMIDGDVKQRILPAEETGFSPGYVNLRGAENREKKIRELVEREGNTLFDLLNGPLLRAKLVQVEEKKYWLLFTIHHIISDFLSMEVLRKEVGILSESLRRGEMNPLGPLRTQYRDYTAWQNEQLAGRQLEQLRKYWQGRFMQADNIPVLGLPYDKMRPAVLSHRGETAAFTIPGKTAAELRTLAEKNNATLFMVLLSSIYVFLFHYSGQTDIVIGTPVAGREHADLENQTGYYLNTLPLRTAFREENTFIELLNMVRKVTLGAFEHQLYPFDRLVDELGIKRDMGRHPLFDVVVDMLNLMEPPGAGERVETQNEITFHQCRSKFDLTVYFIEEAESIGVHFEYSTDLFEKKSKTIERMVNRFRTLLADIIKNTRVPISNLQLQEVEEIPVPAFGRFARD